MTFASSSYATEEQDMAHDLATSSNPGVGTGLPALLTAQALGAFNDNLLKVVVSLVLVGRSVGAGDGSAYLSLSGVAFVLPYLLFSGVAGYLADRYCKRSLLVVAKFIEVAIAVVCFAALLLDRVDLMIAALFLMATQSTFVSPAKYGMLPEMLPDARLSHANGLIESSRYLAVILGTITGGMLLAVPEHSLYLTGAILIGTAVTGAAVSLWITRVPASSNAVPFRINPWHGIGVGVRRIMAVRALQFAVLGITCLEFFGCLVLLDMILMTKMVMGLDDYAVGLLGACVGLGAAFGSYCCGRLSGPHICPVLSFAGMLGVALTLMVLSTVTHIFAAAITIFALGGFGGMAVVPLYTLLQRKAGSQERGQIIATNNFLNMVGVLMASGALWLLNDLAGIGPERVLLWCGITLMLLTLVAMRRWPAYGFGPFARSLAPIYR
jgi:acyl-[acyl-carrier-protein]-phospholipid O-acyltransferase/long-chain-fatty-acid--[acyl-carrier-protein] ligase